MGYATVQSCTLCGVNAQLVTVEVHTSGGLPGMSIVGLPQSAVRESKDRVKAAIQHIGLDYPLIKIIVNLAPADLPKHGGRFDLPIALGILQATDQLPEAALAKLVVAGELGLTGELRSITGVLPTAYAFAKSPLSLFIPMVNAAEALRSRTTRVHAASNLLDAVEQLRATSQQPLVELSSSTLLFKNNRNDSSGDTTHNPGSSLDMADVLGQYKARRALEIAAAGAHNLLMVGPPGTGKSMLASRLPTIQPAMTEKEAMEAASIASISHAGFDPGTWGVRSFRAPHHTASGVALVGGGVHPMPGEISLAHHGVLFLDELPEFSRTVLDVLREPMETGVITISRAARQAEFPSRFQLVAAMNPCPCGYHNDDRISCKCTPDQILRYQSRVSGPFLDRIDLTITLQRENLADGVLTDTCGNECSEQIRQRVVQSRQRQLERQAYPNAELSGNSLKRLAGLTSSASTLFRQATKTLDASLRVQHRVLRVARTIADLDDCDEVSDAHLAESIAYRAVAVMNTL